jgi:capsular polysaccharide biosynthesis protein
MEIKDYYLILKKNLGLLIIITLLFGLVAYLFTTYQKPTYQSSISIEVSRIPALSQSQVDYYQFDNYYTSTVAAQLATNISDWLISPSTVTKIFEKAGYQPPTGDLKGLSKVFTVSKKQETSSVITASYSSSDQAQADKVIAAAGESVKENIDEYNKTESAGKFLVRPSDPVVIATPKNVVLNTVIALFLGFVISLGIISLREALK